MFPNTSSEQGALWRLCAARISFLRCLRSTDWLGAERLVAEVAAIERWSPAAQEDGANAGLADTRRGDTMGEEEEEDTASGGESSFMRLHLALCRGDAPEMEDLLRRMPEPAPPSPGGGDEGIVDPGEPPPPKLAVDRAEARSPVYCARRLLFEVEWYCLCKNYIGKFSCCPSGNTCLGMFELFHQEPSLLCCPAWRSVPISTWSFSSWWPECM